MKKRVRYAVGAIGAVPALGLMIPTANAALANTHTAKPKTKSVNTTSLFSGASVMDKAAGSSSVSISGTNNTCTANTGAHYSSTHGLHLRFFWKSNANHSKTCIGTIQVSGNGGAHKSAGISTFNGGPFCKHSGNGTLNFPCRHSFTDHSLLVFGKSPLHTLIAHRPFKANGFSG